jgi:enoyl-CoA hydratase/carnithine racemase
MENIIVNISKNVGFLTINNPPANALTPELRNELLQKLSSLEQSEKVWTLVIKGEGEKFFVAGADISGLLKLNRNSGLKRVTEGRKLLKAIAQFEKPTICAINGLCMGGGLELALACDIRIAAEHAKMGLPEVSLGLIPGAGGTQRLPRTIGPGWANYLIFTGISITAQKALEIGLIQDVVPYDNLTSATIKLAEKINDNGPLAVRAAKKSMLKGLDVTLEKGIDIENEIFSEVCDTKDKNEGVKAFLEKRKPQFKGH